jgi:hypothetical protein
MYKFTWTQITRNLKSIIDYVIVRKDSLVKTTNFRVRRASCCGTDHYLIKPTFCVPPRKLLVRTKDENKNHQKCNTIKYNFYSLNDESTKILYEQRLSQKLGENAPESAETLYEHRCYCIHSAPRKTFGEQKKEKRR